MHFAQKARLSLHLVIKVSLFHTTAGVKTPGLTHVVTICIASYSLLQYSTINLLLWQEEMLIKLFGLLSFHLIIILDSFGRLHGFYCDAKQGFDNTAVLDCLRRILQQYFTIFHNTNLI